MFGTLVIQLPSDYEGGDLLVLHQGKETKFQFCGPSARSKFYFSAFYADCQHEVKPVTKGYRLCLIYNLLYCGVDKCPAPADNNAQVSTVVSAMKAWNEDIDSADCPKMMTYMLEHQYCPASLSFRLLKNTDRAVADVLIQARSEVEFDLFVGNVELSEHWSALHYGRGNYSTEELFDEDFSAEHLRAYDDKKISSGIKLDKECIVPEDFFQDINPDREDFQEATGNEGASVDKQYHWAALLLWPVRKCTAAIGVSNMIELFEQNVKKNQKDPSLVPVAKAILKELQSSSTVKSSLKLLQALLLIGKVELVIECLDVIVATMNNYSYYVDDTSFPSIVSAVGSKHGWGVLKSPLKAIFEKCTSDKVEKYCQFLLKISSKKLGKEQKDVCKCLAGVFVHQLINEQDANPHSYSSSWGCYRFSSFTRDVNRSKEFVCRLTSILAVLGCNDLLVSFIESLRSKPVRYPVLETLGPAVVAVNNTTKIDREGPLNTLLTYCISTLEASTSKVLSAPPSHARTVKFFCTCTDCIELRRFMQNPNEAQHRFKIGKKRRQHLHQQLDSSGADATHITEHVGNPHTLVVTKTQTSYEKDVSTRQKELTLLAALQPLGEALGYEPSAKKQRAEDGASIACGTPSGASTSYINLT